MNLAFFLNSHLAFGSVVCRVLHHFRSLFKLPHIVQVPPVSFERFRRNKDVRVMMREGLVDVDD